MDTLGPGMSEATGDKKRAKLFNPARRVATYCWIGALVGVGMFLFSISYSLDTYGLNQAIIFAGLVVFLTAVISGILFSRLAATVDKMVGGKGLLAHWEYSPEEWARYTEAEHERDRKDKWDLFKLISIIALVVGVGMFIVKRDAWPVVLVGIPGLILLIAFAAWTSIAGSYYQNRKHPGGAYIAESGALVGRSWHYWKLPLSFVHSVEYQDGSDPFIEIVYSAQSGIARGVYTARVPVPKGREDDARKVVAALSGNA